MEILSIFTVTEYRTGKQTEIAVVGDNQSAISELRKTHPRHSKFVLEGFEIEGEFKPLYIKIKRND